MAYNHVSAISIIALILFLAGSPVSTGQTLGISVQDRLCCTSTGNCLSTSVGIPGVTVSLNCTIRDGVTRTPVILGTNVTDANGVFNITVSGANSRGVVLNGVTIPCGVTVTLPINRTLCNSSLSTSTGFLVARVRPVTLTGTTETAAFGRVRPARIVLWYRVLRVPLFA